MNVRYFSSATFALYQASRINNMRFELAALLAVAASASAQAVVGKAYGFATGVTGGGSAAAVTPTTADELAKYLSDDTARVILITKEFDFTGKTATGSGCDRKSCSASGTPAGQFYLGELSCAASDDNVPVSSITYDTAGTQALKVGSNKSILGVGGKGVLKGKGLSLAKNAKNVIIQGIEFTNINPGVVWGGDALDFQGGNDGVWVDHNKFSLVGRMFIVSHYSASRITVSNNEFDGTTTTSATCNDNHYWTMMFYGDGRSPYRSDCKLQECSNTSQATRSPSTATTTIMSQAALPSLARTVQSAPSTQSTTTSRT